MKFSADQLVEALKAVKAPGSRFDIVQQKQIGQCSVTSERILLEIWVPDLDATIEKSLRYQIEKVVKDFTTEIPLQLLITKKQRADSTANSPISRAPKVKAMIAVGAGKGGVGKSTITLNLSMALQKLGYKVGIMDCDVYGPSIPTMLGLEGCQPLMLDGRIQPLESCGLKVMSAGFFVPLSEGVIWRGPMLHKLVQQFVMDVHWDDCDIVVVDLPPGTGDVPMSLSQTIPLTGVVLVSTPQKVALIDVKKSLSMLQKLRVPIFGLVENMSEFICPHCQKGTSIFDQGGAEVFCEHEAIDFLGSIPLEPKIREWSDKGKPFLLAESGSVAAKRYIELASRVEEKLSLHPSLDQMIGS